ncbi:MAG: BatA domain-containing protein [Rubripirellula sp.]
MSLLAPLYALGLLAIAGPVVVHLIRRQPKESLPFSSLLFLRPTPPRLTKRSRISNWLLLLLRVLAIVALALAFSRPFFRVADQESSLSQGRRVVFLLDTSASMRRSGLWSQALDTLVTKMSELTPDDEACLISFDQQTTIEVDFNRDRSIPALQHHQLIVESAKTLAPSFQGSEIGRALAFAAEQAVAAGGGQVKRSEEDGGSSTSRSRPDRPVSLVLISDLQEGGALEFLQSYPWPSSVQLELASVRPDEGSNASVSLLSGDEGQSGTEGVRVRVDNELTSGQTEFVVGWIDDGGTLLLSQNVQVPPGETRVVNLAPPPQGVIAVQLQGDTDVFDNLDYFVKPEPTEQTVFFVGPDRSDVREDLFHYLNILPLGDQQKKIRVQSIPESGLQQLTLVDCPMVVLAEAVGADSVSLLGAYVKGGGRLLYVLNDSSTVDELVGNLNSIANLDLAVGPSPPVDYSMLSKIDYSHPFFQTMSDPQYSDFSKVKFWEHQSLRNLEEKVSVVASFDDGDPAILEASIEDGSVVVLAFGWEPAQSQFALSTKFLPLIDSMLQQKGGNSFLTELTVGDLSPIPSAEGTRAISLDWGGVEPTDWDASNFAQRPGVYFFESDEGAKTIAVNLSDRESRTDPMDEENFERLDVKLGTLTANSASVTWERQMQNQDLEENQGLWQWVLVIALTLIFAETLFSGMTRNSAENKSSDGLARPSTQST